MLKETEFSASITHPYWFPDKKVSKGDLVVLYSKKGNNSFKENSDKTSTHFYYRDIESSILESNIVLIVEANTWGIEKTIQKDSVSN
ncbi:MAG TPA: hypothetical protein VNW51_07785 [Mucilaginibacter sp.]|jgi:hypothetical protein|nr:hypothetical protein [Mucilaginibacter sp.]